MSTRASSIGPKTKPRATGAKAKSRVIGAKAFAAITAVEGMRLSASSRKRLASLKTSGLNQEQRRAAVREAYTSQPRKK